MNIGIIQEGKVPHDSRVALTPDQCKSLMKLYPDLKIFVEPSEHRCYSDQEYIDNGITMSNNLEHCDILFGVKEVPVLDLISNKTYLFFSHTIKKQPYNRDLLRAILNRNIQLIDYETLKNKSGQRVIAFGHWAGVVGAHNAIQAWGKRTKQFDLKSMFECKDFLDAQSHYTGLKMDPVKIVVTGDGRVGKGSCQTLDLMGFQEVAPEKFLTDQFDKTVYTLLGAQEMYRKHDYSNFDIAHYYQHPEEYASLFDPYTKVSDIMINAIYWDKRIPVFFTKEDMKSDLFKIDVIADITCDIAPVSSIPSTLRASEIGDPVYGYDPILESECPPFEGNSIDVMAVDNLPNELPRDASQDFGNQLITQVIPELLAEKSNMIYQATITKDGKLNEPYEYLKDFVSHTV